MKKFLKITLSIIAAVGIAAYVLVGPLAIFANHIYVEVYDETVSGDFSSALESVNDEYSRLPALQIFFSHVKPVTTSENKIVCLPYYSQNIPEPEERCPLGKACNFTYNPSDKKYLEQNKCPFYIASVAPSSDVFGTFKYKRRILDLGKRYNVKVDARPYHSF